jgi:hypothetical protein
MSQPSESRPAASPDVSKVVDLVWPDDIGANAAAVNQVMFANDQSIQDVVYLYLGHIAPPPWLTEGAAQQRLQALGNTLPVTAKGSFVMSRTRAEELWLALGRHLGKLPPE